MAYFGELRVEPLSSISKRRSPMHSHYASTLRQDRRSGAGFPVGSLNQLVLQHRYAFLPYVFASLSGRLPGK